MDDWLLRLDMTSKNCSHSILPQQILKIEYNKYEFIEIHCQIVLRDISRCFCNIVHEPIFFTSLNEGRDDWLKNAVSARTLKWKEFLQVFLVKV